MNYAEDTQLIAAVDSSHPHPFRSIQSCMADISLWLTNNCLKFNASKTDFLCVSSPRLPTALPSQLFACLNLSESTSALSVRNLGVEFDAHLSLNAHIKKISAMCFSTLRALRKILPILPTESRSLVVQATVCSRLDYCNALFLRSLDYALKRLQHVQSAAA